MTGRERIAVITPVYGRQAHLRRQQHGLDRGTRRPDLRVLVGEPPELPGACGVPLARTAAGLPLAGARNAGARAALDAGADILVFLDVDCVPGPDLVLRYSRAVRALGGAAAGAGPGLLCGPVSYLPPPPPGGYDLDRLPVDAEGHPARPTPQAGQLLPGGDHRLFWSLSFALTAADWVRIGGFCEDYVGYGGEDTDFGQLAAAAGLDLTWVGGAWAHHQHHPVQDPPVDHLLDILRNAAIFHRRWGWWPMQGWLTGFAALGLAAYDAAAQSWTLAPTRSPALSATAR